MAEVRKTLGQAFPAAGALTALYTAGVQAISSTLFVCNQASVATTFRVSKAVNGAADSPAQYIFFDTDIGAKETRGFTVGLAFGVGDIMRVQSANGQTSFDLEGVEL